MFFARAQVILSVTFVKRRGYDYAQMMETAQTSETSVNSYQSTRSYNPEDRHLRAQSRENLKSYSELIKPTPYCTVLYSYKYCVTNM
jgi:hypothetical protein